MMIEEERMKYTMLAGNPHLWQALYGEQQEGNIEWIKPETAEDLERIINIVSVGTGSEVSIS